MKQFKAFVRKEFYHIFRDRRTMLILLVMPVILIFIFGYAVTNELKNTRLGIVDVSCDEMTRKIAERFSANRYFEIAEVYHDDTDIEKKFRDGTIDMALIFGNNFAAEVLHGGNPEIMLLVDGSEPNQASMRVGYASQVLASVGMDMAERMNLRRPMNIVPHTRMLYNPQQESAYNFVPGVIGLILMLICTMLSSVAIVREKEYGSMEVLLASPLPPVYIILAKFVPYFIISCLNLLTILILSVAVLHVPVAGSVLYLLFVSFLYILTALALGLLISTLVRSQLAALLLSMLVIVPTIYLSGLAFPIESMPVPMQTFSAIVPARWFIEAARKLMIQGVEIQYVLKETAILIVMVVVLTGIAIKNFKTRLE